MLNRRTIVLCMLTAWVALPLAVATAQAPPPEPTTLSGSMAGCPSIEDTQRLFKDISEIRVGLQLEGKEIPEDCSQGVFQGTRRSFALSDTITEFQWAPANFFHQPLYLDDTPLERYGQSVCPHLQPIISGGRFFLTLPIIPYKMGYDHPYDCVTILGHYRPGVCAPCVMQVPPPLQLSSALLQAGTTVGLVLLVP